MDKKMDETWMSENNTDGRPMGVGYSVPCSNNTWYYCFEIKKTNGTIGWGFDTSVTATNLLADATGYTLFRCLGKFRV